MMCASRLIAGVVHEDVDRSRARCATDSKNAVTSRFGADVAPPGPGAPAAPAHVGDELRRRRVLLAIGDGDRCAALGEELGDAAADAARPAGDDGDTAVELKIVEGHCLRGARKIISGSLHSATSRGRIRSTTLTTAPPLATLLTSTISPGASRIRICEPEWAGDRIGVAQAGNGRHSTGRAAEHGGHAGGGARRAAFADRALDRRHDRCANRRRASTSARASTSSRRAVALADA